MTIRLYYLLLLLCIGPWVRGQVKIGDNPQDLDPASILELESTSRALVISRVTTSQMNAITPLRGAMVYNTDADCLYYYSGTGWINLCEASGGAFTFTTDPVVNTGSGSIIITQTGNNYNIEVGEITGNNIVNSTIRSADLQGGIITFRELADNAVIPGKIGTGAVGTDEIENGSIQTVDIAPEGPNKFLSTDANGIVEWANKSALSTIADQETITGTGTATDPLKVSDGITTAIANNTMDITDHIAVDGDTDSTNELQTLSEVLAQGAAANGRITDLNDPTGPQDAATRAYVDNVVGGATQTIISTDIGNSITPGSDNGAFFNATPLQNEIASNTTDIALKEDISNKSTDINLGTSNDFYPTQNAVKVYVDNATGGPGQTIVSADANNSIQAGTIDGGAFYNDADGDATNELTDLDYDETTHILSLTKSATTTGKTVDLSDLANEGIADGSVTLDKLNDGTAAGQLMQWNGTAWILITDSDLTLTETDGIIGNEVTDVTNTTLTRSGTGTITDPFTLGVTPLGITDAELADGSVTLDKLNDGTAAGQLMQWNGTAWILIPTPIPTGTTGSVFFSDGAGGLLENNSNLFWDNTNEGLGIGTAIPDAKLHVDGDFHLTEHFVDGTNSAGTVGQVLTSTATGTAWANPVVAVNPIFASGKVTASDGTDGAYNISFSPPLPNTDYIIQTTVVQNIPAVPPAIAMPLIIQVTSQTNTGFSVQIYEFDGGTFNPVNAEWFYTILNP